MMPRLIKHFMFLLVASVICSCSTREKEAERIAAHYNYVIGTQTIGPRYKFTEDHVLVETACRILEMGSNSIKIKLCPGDIDLDTGKDVAPKIMAEECPVMKSILDMDFSYIFMWVTTPGVDWSDGMTTEEQRKEYSAIKELAEYLLTTYKGSQKQFFIGHWEGDWLLLGNYSRTQEHVDETRINGMIDWYNIRQQAVEDARRQTISDVKIYHYLELNRVNPALYLGYDRVVNRVLPYVNVDYVSYSSYESTSEEISGANYEEMRNYLKASLDYIENQMKPNHEILGHRVFIGEYGYSLPLVDNSPLEQARRSVNTIRAALEWGCPFILYWEMYDNEGDDKGFWMINYRNEEQPVYMIHKDFYQQMKQYVYNYAIHTGSAPSQEIFQQEAITYLSNLYTE